MLFAVVCAALRFAAYARQRRYEQTAAPAHYRLLHEEGAEMSATSASEAQSPPEAPRSYSNNAKLAT